MYVFNRNAPTDCDQLIINNKTCSSMCKCKCENGDFYKFIYGYGICQQAVVINSSEICFNKNSIDQVYFDGLNYNLASNCTLGSGNSWY